MSKGGSLRYNEQFFAEYQARRGSRFTTAVQTPAKAIVDTTKVYPVLELCRIYGVSLPVPEFVFHPTRKWRADYAWPTHMLLLECDGGIWTQGRHSRGSGRLADMEKLSEAAILGYRVLYTTPGEVENGAVLDRVKRALTAPEQAFR